MNRSSIYKLTAADVMRRDLIVVYDRDSLQQAMELMTANHVTGLPVVNNHGVCVGIITASDILNYEQEHSDLSSETNAHMTQLFNPDTQQWESVRVSSFALEQFGEVRVQEVMTADLISVRPDARLREVARTLRDAKIHRVLVLNEEQRLLGIITSSDFVRLFAEMEEG